MVAKSEHNNAGTVKPPTTSDQAGKPETDTSNAQTGGDLPHADPQDAIVRSGSLLPPGEDPDARFDVAEEVSLDQQSDSARRVGALPPDPAPGARVADAVAASVGQDTAKPDNPPSDEIAPST